MKKILLLSLLLNLYLVFQQHRNTQTEQQSFNIFIQELHAELRFANSQLEVLIESDLDESFIDHTLNGLARSLIRLHLMFEGIPTFHSHLPTKHSQLDHVASIILFRSSPFRTLPSFNEDGRLSYEDLRFLKVIRDEISEFLNAFVCVETGEMQITTINHYRNILNSHYRFNQLVHTLALLP